MANGPILPQDNINYIDKTVQHPEYGVAKVVAKEKNELTLLLADKTTQKVDKDTVTIVKEDNEYSEYLTHASDEIRAMFDAFSPEDKKKYAEVVKHTPTQTEFHFDVKRNNGTIQHAVYKVNKQRVNIPDDDLKAGIIEKYEESGYKGAEYFGNKTARSKYTPGGQGLTIDRFKALVKAMPAGDFLGIGTSNSAVSIRQLFISLGGKRSEYRPVNSDGVVENKIAANNENGYGYHIDDNKEVIARKGYLALEGTDALGNTIVITAMKDSSDYDKGTAILVDEKQMYPRITLAEKPIITYTKDGKPVDKEGNQL